MSAEPAPPASGRPRHRLTRALLGVLALAVAAAPFAAVWGYDTFRSAVPPQAPAPDSRPGAGTPAHAASARGPSAPIALSYHDIAPGSHSRYTVTPERFDAQLSALREAGYRTLSTEEFVRFLETGRAPAPRSVYLTFDDGTHGLWVHADPILAKHRMKAAAYLITGRVGTRRPYYLSWAEVDRMAGSGRWDFQSHSHLSHRRVPVDASGRLGSALANRLWLPGEKRLETAAEYRGRVRQDIDRSLDGFRDHDLPAPRLFSYPFSESPQRAGGSGGSASPLHELLRERFTAALTNTSTRPLPPGRRAAAAGHVQRLAVTGATTARELLRQLDTWASARPGDIPDPLARPGLWRSRSGRPGAGLDAVAEGDGPPRRRHAGALYRPLATADWSTYRVRATAGGLRTSTHSVSLTVRHGSVYPFTVTVDADTVRLTQQVPGAPPRVTRAPLDSAPSHRLDVRVTPGAVRVTVDAGPVLVRPTGRTAPGETSGGIALDVRNTAPGTAWPRVTSLRVSP
ncbi:polysaccharide deacetylase family protein [Streptomyces lycii]|uniref:Polysaccharide deacetylase family protein n=1 Tax=Streptomyces lycii TaxID=2654337 RepID=A0ABQ7FNI4_9ACTN|nr:polysaccharide deacetylase family protein [Streptomyces lycii]KAF4409189.1 polysaccharide deacetylase family protein [Streptomyces lycii]